MTRLDWEDLKVFVALSREGNMRDAGEALGVHASTVARRIEQFEKKLGVRLFDRNGHGLTRTAAGKELMGLAERVEAEIEQIERRLAGRDERMAGSIRFGLPGVLGTASFLLRDLAAFAARWPEIELHVDPAATVAELGRGDADVVIVATGTPPEHLVGRRLADHALAGYATADYLARHDPQRDAAACTLIAGTHGEPAEHLVRASSCQDVPVRARFGSVALQAEAAATGMGIALLPLAIGDADPRLVRVPPGSIVAAGAIWLLTHSEIARTARMRAFMDCVSGSFRRNRARFAAAQEAEPALVADAAG
jgi:DNA-binding transcriptional LysR family regulator